MALPTGALPGDIMTASRIVMPGRGQVHRDLVRLRVEYSFIEEGNGVPDLGLPDAPFRNDELLVQAELRF